MSPSPEKEQNAEPVAGGVAVVIREGEAHIDLRGLEPPRPLIATLELISRPGAGDTVVATFDRNPVNLFPELAELGWSWTRLPGPGESVSLRLTRKASGERLPGETA